MEIIYGFFEDPLFFLEKEGNPDKKMERITELFVALQQWHHLALSEELLQRDRLSSSLGSDPTERMKIVKGIIHDFFQHHTLVEGVKTALRDQGELCAMIRHFALSGEWLLEVVKQAAMLSPEVVPWRLRDCFTLLPLPQEEIQRLQFEYSFFLLKKFPESFDQARMHELYTLFFSSKEPVKIIEELLHLFFLARRSDDQERESKYGYLVNHWSRFLQPGPTIELAERVALDTHGEEIGFLSFVLQNIPEVESRQKILDLHIAKEGLQRTSFLDPTVAVDCLPPWSEREKEEIIAALPHSLEPLLRSIANKTYVAEDKLTLFLKLYVHDFHSTHRDDSESCQLLVDAIIAMKELSLERKKEILMKEFPLFFIIAFSATNHRTSIDSLVENMMMEPLFFVNLEYVPLLHEGVVAFPSSLIERIIAAKETMDRRMIGDYFDNHRFNLRKIKECVARRGMDDQLFDSFFTTIRQKKTKSLQEKNFLFYGEMALLFNQFDLRICVDHLLATQDLYRSQVDETYRLHLKVAGLYLSLMKREEVRSLIDMISRMKPSQRLLTYPVIAMLSAEIPVDDLKGLLHRIPEVRDGRLQLHVQRGLDELRKNLRCSLVQKKEIMEWLFSPSENLELKALQLQGWSFWKRYQPLMEDERVQPSFNLVKEIFQRKTSIPLEGLTEELQELLIVYTISLWKNEVDLRPLRSYMESLAKGNDSSFRYEAVSASHLELLFQDELLRNRWIEGATFSLEEFLREEPAVEVERVHQLQERLIALLPAEREEKNSMLEENNSLHTWKRVQLNSVDAIVGRILQETIEPRDVKNLLKKLEKKLQKQAGDDPSTVILKENMDELKKMFFPPKKNLRLVGAKLVDTDDVRLLLRSGFDVDGSCQDYTAHSNISEGLIGLLLNPSNRMVAIVKDGKIMSRAIIRLLIDQETMKPVLQQEKVYMRGQHEELRSLIDAMCQKRADQLGVPLVRFSGEPTQHWKKKSKGILASFQEGTVLQYVDAFGGLTGDFQLAY